MMSLYRILLKLLERKLIAITFLLHIMLVLAMNTVDPFSCLIYINNIETAKP